jgi:hypothetical protein
METDQDNEEQQAQHQFKLETPDKLLIDVNFQRDETIGMLKVQTQLWFKLVPCEVYFG